MARFYTRSKRKTVVVTSVFCIIIWLTLHSQITKYPDEQTRSYISIQGGLLNLGTQGSYQHISNNSRQPHQVSNSQESTTVNPSIDGEELATRLRDKCSGYLNKLPQRLVRFPVTSSKQYKIMFCPMCKLASTYWTRFFKLLEEYHKNENVSTPYDIPIKVAKPTQERLQVTKGQKISAFENYYKFVFVRNPYARILSAYVDKLFAPNPYFWKSICKRMITVFRRRGKSASKCGSDLQFNEYIRAINVAHQRPFDSGSVDCHDATFMGASHPCEVQYDYIGKMESFAADSKYLYKKFNLYRSIDVLQAQGKQLADDDALNDTVTSPFAWKTDIKKCIPWHEALNRIWKKLQIRGVIGKQPLPLTAEEADNITQQEFLDLINKTQKLTSYEMRKRQRDEALIEIYSTVDAADLNQLKVSYKNDFDFFEYDDSPSFIFNISKTDIKYYGYLDL